MLGRHLQKVLQFALHDAQRRKHEFLTIEHVLFAIASESQGRILLEGCGASPPVLREQLEGFFSQYLDIRPENSRGEILQTEGVQRVLENALQHIRSAGRELVELGDVLAAIMDEKDAYASHFLKKHGVTKTDVLEAISHGPAGNGSRGVKGGKGGQPQEKEDPLSRFTIDLTAKAQAGKIDPLVGRTAELDRTVEVLCRRRKNNPLFIGDPGVGKTAMAEGLALRIAEKNIPELFADARIFTLDMGTLLAGARYRGDFENRLKNVVEALKKIPKAILFIDEIHTLVGAGASSGGALDASNLLKPMLAEGEVRCMGSTTHEEYRNHLEKDKALLRRFQQIDIREPSTDECLDILRGLQDRYAKHHKVRYPVDTLKAVVELSARHVQDRLLPDKAIDVMDEAGAAVFLQHHGVKVADEGSDMEAVSQNKKIRVKITKRPTVSVQDIERIVARMAGIPQRSVSSQEKQRLATLEQDVCARVFGQNEAVALTVKAILRSRAGLARENRPAGSFLFYGPTGVGKTELARQLAEHLGVEFIRYDMSEYMEKHAVSRFIGAPPGYVGFEQGGQLTDAIRKTPYALVLLDEIEKAHPDIFNVLLQVMDYGTLTDNAGRKADFRHVILIMTSNAGVREMSSGHLGFGAQKQGDVTSKGLKAVEETFSPEFRNRLDALIPFVGLTQDLMENIVDKFTDQLAASLVNNKVTMHLTSTARQWLAIKGYDKVYGARPLQRLIRTEIEDVLAKELLFGALHKGGIVTIDAQNTAAEHLSFHYAPNTSKGPKITLPETDVITDAV